MSYIIGNRSLIVWGYDSELNTERNILLMATRIYGNMDEKQPQSKDLFFDPANHPDDTLKAFDDFTQVFELRYEAQSQTLISMTTLFQHGNRKIR